jgi:hypothetical protein
MNDNIILLEKGLILVGQRDQSLLGGIAHLPWKEFICTVHITVTERMKKSLIHRLLLQLCWKESLTNGDI